MPVSSLYSVFQIDWRSACLVIVAFAAGLNGAGCAPDESCAETATCPHPDGGQRDGYETGAGDAKSEAGTVGDVLDASPGIDRSDRDAPAQDRAVPGTDAPSEAGAAIDARRNDVANNDGPSKIDIGVLDAAIDQRMPEPDSGGGGWEGAWSMFRESTPVREARLAGRKAVMLRRSMFAMLASRTGAADAPRFRMCPERAAVLAAHMLAMVPTR
ncbi:MAG TPA: hypothetical protein VK550_18150 [Polyangiaceae bacterium]|nr:hypothetical protein [Polyangiaceae bacterium]